MPQYRRKLILEELGRRLERILVENGFDTDAGQRVFFGPVTLGPDDPPIALAVVPGTTQTNFQPRQGTDKRIALPVEVQAFASSAKLDQPLLTVESLIGDIKRAVERPGALGVDRNGRPLALALTPDEVEMLPRVEGTLLVGARVGYRVLYVEIWGDPESDGQLGG